MLGPAILWLTLGGAVGAGDYLRPLGAKALDQATLDAEGYGDKKGLAREDDGLRIAAPQGGAEAGWKAPPNLRVGGDCTIVATLQVRKLPKPGAEDGVAIGLAVAAQNVDAPEATLLRQVELDGKEVFRPVNKADDDPQQNMMMGRRVFNPFQAMPEKPAKPARVTFPAKGSAIRLGVRREGSTLHYEVGDDLAPGMREVGHFQFGPADIAGLKVFVSNRSGTEAVEILLKDVTVRADRVTGLGTAVRTVFGTVVHGEPTKLDGSTLFVGAGAPGQAPPPGAVPASPPGVVLEAGNLPPGVVIAGAPGAVVAQATTVEVAVAQVAPAAVPAPAAPAPAAAEKPKDAEKKDGKDAKEKKDGAVKPAEPPKEPEPKAKIPLDEVESITFERAAVVAARWLGQPNVDATRAGGDDAIKADKEAARDQPKDQKDKEEKDKPKDDASRPAADDLAAPPPGTAVVEKIPKVEPRPSGVRDLHLVLSGLHAAALKQVMIQCPTDKGQQAYRLDTAGSKDWPLVVARAGTETWADLFLEPPPGDCHDKQLTITLNYADGQQANATVKATEHTDPKLKFDPDSPVIALDARVYLAGDEQLYGKLEAVTEEALTLLTPWGDKVDVPLVRVVGVYMGMSDHKESPDSFARRLKGRGDQDLLLARAKDGEVVAIAGVVEAVKAGKLTFQYQGKSRTLPIKGVEGMVLANRPAPPAPTEVRPTFELTGGIVVSGRWAGITPETWQVEAPWGQTFRLPAATVQAVRVRGGQMSYLSDLEPVQVEEVPYFGRRVPYRRDGAQTGGPLKLDGRSLAKGLAVHSRTALTYDLGRRFERFEALVGFDEAGNRRGRVDCRVLLDGKELYANPDLRADGPTVPLNLPVAGGERLQLVVDFGPDDDIGDRLIWGNARLYRKPAAPAAPTATGPATNPKPASGQ